MLVAIHMELWKKLKAIDNMYATYIYFYTVLMKFQNGLLEIFRTPEGKN